MPEAERERIFEPFVRGRAAQGPGSGLGLSIVRAVAARLDGEVSALAPGPRARGDHFRFCVPLAVATNARVEA